MDVDVVRILDAFANEVAMLADGVAPSSLVGRTHAALRAALTAGAGRPDEECWSRLYCEAGRLIGCLDDGVGLPGLRAFLAENADLRDAAVQLVRS